jgi:hypothetical protein
MFKFSQFFSFFYGFFQFLGSLGLEQIDRRFAGLALIPEPLNVNGPANLLALLAVKTLTLAHLVTQM